MTKKEKLINWAREKFENDKGGTIYSKEKEEERN